MKIVVATHNKGKLREFKAALETVGIEAVSIGEVVKVPERKKRARLFGQRTH